MAFVDVDNDAQLDLAIVNGHVIDNTAMFRAGSSHAQQKLLLRNTNGRRFVDVGRQAGAGFAVRVNGRPVERVAAPGSYVELTRKWSSGDRVELVLPKALHLEPLPDNADRVALMWGPLVLAGDLTGSEITPHTPWYVRWLVPALQQPRPEATLPAQTPVPGNSSAASPST